MAIFDATKNFGKVTVSTGYDASATSIVLASGHGAKLPLPSTDGEFNLVWWNNSDYGDPSDDPNKEIVRCTARSTDTLTVTRNQESTGASIKNISSKTYRMALTITAKVIDDIVDNLGASSTINVAQTSHGFAVGDVLRSSGTDGEYTKAQSDSAANSEVVGMVTTVTDTNNYIITTSGLIDTAAAVPTQTAGTVMFLDPSTAGAITATEPTTSGQVSKPIAIVTESNAEMIFINFRGAVITDVDAPSTTYITVKLGTEADGGDNKTFSLTTGTFTAGKYLNVYKNGSLQEEGTSADYQTSGTDKAVFNSNVLDTDKITLIVRAYTNSLSRSLGLSLFASNISVSTGDGTVGIPISEDLNGMIITSAVASVHTKGITGTTDVQIRRRREGVDVDMLSTKITIGDEFHASDSVIDTANDDLLTGDLIYFDVDAIHSGTAPLGLGIMITAE